MNPNLPTDFSRKRSPTIARVWRGRTPLDRADEYEKYNYEIGIRPLEEKAVAVQTFREDRENETEFITISYWESIESMGAFTGTDPAAVHHLPRDKEFLIELPRSVQILQLLKNHGWELSPQKPKTAPHEPAYENSPPT